MVLELLYEAEVREREVGKVKNHSCIVIVYFKRQIRDVSASYEFLVS